MPPAAPGTLFVCGTPIGNLEDASPRLLRTLREVDHVLCEDTRRTAKLLASFGVRARTESFQGYAEKGKTAKALEALRAGRDLAIVSDAGMPALSDPGSYLVNAAADEGIPVRIVPGPDSVSSALALSGMGGSSFAFIGFPERSAKKRRARFEELSGFPGPLVLFESPRRLAATLTDALVALGDRRVVVARELTKAFEETVRGRLSQLAGRFQEQPPRGEVVLVIEGREGPAERPSGGLSDTALVVTSLRECGLPPAKAASLLARLTGMNRKEAYERITESG